MNKEHAYAYSRTTAFGTAIERILYGSLTGPTPSDVVLVKPNSLELLQLTPSRDADDSSTEQILTARFEQPTFGTITDAHILPCHFQNDHCDDRDGGSGGGGCKQNVVSGASSSSNNNNSDSEMDYEEEEEPIDEIPYAFKLREDHAPILGEDVMVAISEYGKLVFWGVTAPSGDLAETGRFEPLVEIFMDDPGLEYQKVSKKLAVDPYSRAIAIAAYEDRFDIMIMNKAVSRTHFDPVIGMGSVSEEGIIWHMEFLHTESAGRDRILLALMVFNDIEMQCRIIIYAIDASNPEDVLIERVGRLPLDTNSPIPVLFVPLKHHPEAFLLVTQYEAGLVTIEDIASGNLYYPRCLIPRPFGEVDCPLLTVYATPSWPLSSAVPYMYFGSDNGCFFKVSFPSKHQLQWEVLHSINPVAQAMCVLGVMEIAGESNENHLADIVFYAGEGADSQVVAIPRETEEHDYPSVLVMQNFVNRAPLFDMRIRPTASGQNMIVGCTGQSKQGSLCTVTRGVRTRIVHTIDGAWEGTSRMWSANITTAGSGYHPFLILSSAHKNAVISTRDGHLDELSSLQHDKQLILADSILADTRSLLIQVTSDSVVIFDDIVQGRVAARWPPIPTEAQAITLAAVCQGRSGIPSYIAMSLVDKSGQASLALLQINVDNDRISFGPCIVQSTTSEPSYIGYFVVNNQPVLVVGTYDASLLIYGLEGEGHVRLLDQEDLGKASQEKDAACVILNSAAVLTYPKNEGALDDDESQGSSGGILLVGTRLGSIMCFPLACHSLNSNGRFFCTDSDNKPMVVIRQIGKRSVRFDPGQKQQVTGALMSPSILALADQLWRIRYNAAYPDSVEIDPVLLLPSFDCLSAVVSFSVDGIHKDMVGLVADGQFHIMTLAPECGVDTQKTLVKETMNKIMLDRSSGHAFVATIAMDTSNYRTKNTVRLVGSSSEDGAPLVLLNERVFQPTDEILCMAEWTLVNREKTYRYLCLGIGQTHHATHRNRVKKTGTDRGALMIYRLKESKTRGRLRYTLRPVMNKEHLPGGVFAICPHPAGLLFSAGPVLFLYQLDTDAQEPKLIEIAKTTLRFLITSIQVEGDRICVSCQTDSMSFYKLNTETNKLEFLKSDVTARTIHHAMMLTNRIAVGAGQSGGMIALWDNPDDQACEQRLITLFCFHYSDIILRPTLASFLPSSVLGVVIRAKPIAGHVLPWTTAATATASEAAAAAITKPIMGVSVSGCVVRVHQISQPLYSLLVALQERMMAYSSAMFILLGSARDFQWFRNLSQKEKHVIHGDLVVLFLRLLPEQQRQVIEMNEPEQPSIVQATKAFLQASANDAFPLDGWQLEEEQDERAVLWKYAGEIATMLVQVLSALERCC